MCLNGQRYFITFIDDYSRYMYLFLLNDKCEVLDAFKIYKAKVEEQLGKQIKIVKSDRGGEYYESHNARFLENDVISGSNEPRHLVFEEGHNIEPTTESSKYDIDIGAKDDPIMFSQAVGGSESTLWYTIMKDEMNSMVNNQIWDLVELPKGIDYHDTFSPISKKDSFRIIMTLVAHFDMELHQMDVKTTFPDEDLEEEKHMKQPEGFITNDCSPGIAPIVKCDRFSLNQCPSNDLEKKEMKNISYAFVVRSLMYAQVCTRPDISYAIGMLGKYQSNPSLEYWKAIKKVMRYVKGTRDYKLTYKRFDHLDVVGYSSSDFAGCLDSRKSTSGYVFLLAKEAISWKSAKQTLAIWLRCFISRLEVVDSISKSLRIYCDNFVVVFLAKNNKNGSHSKHIDIKYLAITEHVKSNKVSIEHISTGLMIADPLMKGLPLKAYKEHVEHMRLNFVL
uniref:Reverse transcriptase Ty1/copia-type domain-containing protein n=1 Tax=Vitis vinifera TaxID=29760 RepID=A5BGU2_VITVI|nr:hypothetical protein VITISV_007257 [Vitis vinifera]